jgi:hypothetical protein
LPKYQGRGKKNEEKNFFHVEEMNEVKIEAI